MGHSDIPARRPRGEWHRPRDERSGADDEWSPSYDRAVDPTALLASAGADLEDLAARADGRRAAQVGEAVTYVVNRNLDPAVVAGPGADPDRVPALVAEAVALGATEVCLQGGLPAGSPFADELALLRAVRAGDEGVHVHALRPPEVDAAAARAGLTVPAFLAAARTAGLGSLPGTAAQVLDDGVRARLAPPGVAPPPVASWVRTVTAAHDAGLRTTATLLVGHVETPAQVVAHLGLLRALQQRTGGFTELIVMPLLPAQAPHLGDRVPGAVDPEVQRRLRATVAVARLLLGDVIPHLQVAWPRLGALGPAGRDALVDALLRGGCDDLGGLLVAGTLQPGAGQEAGHGVDLTDVRRWAARAGRPLVPRTTTYGRVGA